MEWNTLYYGVAKPSTGRRLAINTMLAVMLMAFYGGWIDFVPEPWVERSSLYAALLLGVAVSVWLAWINISGRNKSYLGGTGKMILLTPFCAVIATGFIWCALAHGLAGAITRLGGETAIAAPVQMYTNHRSRRHECDYQLRGGPMTSFLFDHLCTSAVYYEAHPARRVEVVLAGFRGPLGFYVKAFSHRGDLGAYRP